MVSTPASTQAIKMQFFQLIEKKGQKEELLSERL